MNLRDASGILRGIAFRLLRAIASIFPGGKISAFGTGEGLINSILIVNLDRQPRRWRRVVRELRRFRTADDVSLASIARRFAAVDARDGRAVAATADVDSTYRIGDQLYVQPDARLEECFPISEPIKMTRQEVAVARSHVEVWKTIACGADKYVLVLEDDVWFKRGAAAAISLGWRAAIQHCCAEGGPRLLYLSYADAGGTAERVDLCDSLFRPVRGLWFLSGYVLSREGAAALLRAMPVIGPVDMWINYRFGELGALALASPVILQRQDSGSDNSYSVLPYLARAGIIDAGSGPMAPKRTGAVSVLAWTTRGEHEGLAMALSMLGLRVRVFDGDEGAIQPQDLLELFEIFDALVDAPLTPAAVKAAIARNDIRFLMEAKTVLRSETWQGSLPPSRTAILSYDESDSRLWEPLCSLLSLTEPVQSFPVGTPRCLRMFRDGKADGAHRVAPSHPQQISVLDESPWVLPAKYGWQPRVPSNHPIPPVGELLVFSEMTTATSSFPALMETFPGNLVSFSQDALVHDKDGAHLIVSKVATATRQYRSGAFASKQLFGYGRFEAQIKAASGSGLITGFFLHRDAPRQEIDIELAGDDPRSMLVNVYFNPGDDGAAINFGYRGSPCRIDLGFDATLDFHVYTIDWRPDRITWSVDGHIVHERAGWDPTPIPHLPMRLHANLWAPRSEELAGRLDPHVLPATASFKKVSVWA
ncbi:glycosyl hydrolase family protein [Pseudomonas aeruginosa]|uniref:family 16 glycosylhydrolase n=1 Tax=Pseudomonas aeruginosa TaxID=287 RepID=UPI00044B56BF|nr:family 16 glycosylhydrolase [Pseudomonas aeruginosa]EKB9382439.1 family 16 glycosylhydrolase [Pseudomonas aeruginosa]EKV2963720.1 family 16 glycosylhydrolase [Pseudomonas aeruginosa]EKV3144171.1 family 16 glycosylhydrolase [Pseudomonas aeruginosa]EKY0800206.1 family 16 glycosylhydrolase [Pseudomonas aeruginosa]ELD4448439.1 family 16 glycosylhydrolase [Pseudomonas aeruginosa]